MKALEILKVECLNLLHNQVIFLFCVPGTYFRCKAFLPRCAMTELRSSSVMFRIAVTNYYIEC